MLKSRCPWCGKITNRYYDQQSVKKRKTPMNLRFAQCSYCNNYYGQNAYSNRNKLCFLGVCLLLLLGIITESLYIAFSAVFLILFLAFSPIVKMDENENEILSNPSKLKIEIISNSSKIKLNKLYFLDNKFDKYDCFSVVSPLYIHSFDKKTKKFIVSYLYEHPQNVEYTNNSCVDLYDSDMKEVAKINFVK